MAVRASSSLRIAAVLGMVVTLAACGSSGSSRGSVGNTGSAATSSGSSLSGTIKVGMVCDCSGANGAAQASSKPAIEAWEQWTNAHGGVNGHSVDVIVQDDNSSATTAAAEVRTLVEQDHVIAIVGEASNYDYAFADYLSQKDIPVIGGITSTPPMSTNPDFFPSGTPIALIFYGMVAHAKDAGLSKVAVTYCAEAPACAQVTGLVKAAASVTGSSVVATSKAAAAAPSYTSQCLTSMSAGAQGLDLALSSNISLRVLTDCANQGSKMVPLLVGSTFDSTWEKNSAAQGAIGVDGDFPFFADQDADFTANITSPATKAYHDAIKQYAPSLPGSALNDSSAAYSWAGGQLFLAAAQAVNLGPNSTGADVKTGLYKVSGTTLGGLAPPLTFTPEKPASVSCYFTVGIKNDHFYSPDGLNTTCPASTAVGAYYKALGS